LKGELGHCQSGPGAMVASTNAHTGEEPPISGTNGSGTVFFSGCPLGCVFCQNWPISQEGVGNGMSDSELASRMLDLQHRGCHNINLVTPTHQVPAFLGALETAIGMGLRIPIVYNTGGFESQAALELLDGVVDVYLPDIKYADDAVAERYSGAGNYVEINRLALRAMYGQVGRLKTGEDGLAESGMIVRHLVLPHGSAGTGDCMKYVADIDRELHVSLMMQYFPAHGAHEIPELSRKLTVQEQEAARSAFFDAGLRNGWIQDEY